MGPRKDNNTPSAGLLADIADMLKQNADLARKNHNFHAMNAFAAATSSVSALSLGAATCFYVHSGVIHDKAATAKHFGLTAFNCHAGFSNVGLLGLDDNGDAVVTVGRETTEASAPNLYSMPDPTDTTGSVFVYTSSANSDKAFIGGTSIGTEITAIVDVIGGNDNESYSPCPAAFNTPPDIQLDHVYYPGDVVMPALDSATTPALTASAYRCISSVTPFKTDNAAEPAWSASASFTDTTADVEWIKDESCLANFKLAETVTYQIGGRTYTKTGPVWNAWKLKGFNVLDGYTAKLLLCIDASGTFSIHSGIANQITSVSRATSSAGGVPYSAGTTYNLKDVVLSDGFYYWSTTDYNTGNDPASSPLHWKGIEGDMPATPPNVAILACIEVHPVGGDFIGGTTRVDASIVTSGGGYLKFLDTRRMAAFTL